MIEYSSALPKYENLIMKTVQENVLLVASLFNYFKKDPSK